MTPILSHAIPANAPEELKQKALNTTHEKTKKIANDAAHKVLNSIERAVYIVPVIGEIAAVITSLDTAIAAARNVSGGSKEIKTTINKISQSVPQHGGAANKTHKYKEILRRTQKSIDNFRHIKKREPKNSTKILQRTQKAIDDFRRDSSHKTHKTTRRIL